MDPIVIRDFAIALLIGALVGIEREKRKALEPDIVGVRTFILVALAGAVSAWVSVRLATALPLAVTVGAIGALVAAGHVVHARGKEPPPGMTTEVAAVGVCLLGGACLLGAPEIAVALAIAMSAVLAFKQPIHAAVGRLGLDDFYAGLKLLVATFIVLPLLPDRAVDPWGALNPYRLWWLVVLISALSFVGYVAVRWLGAARGTTVTGLFGGLVSSTAVTLAFARESRDGRTGRTQADALAAGLLLAWSVMFVRMAAIAAVVHPPLAALLGMPFGVLAAATAALAGHRYWRSLGAADATTSGAPDVPLRNPFSLAAATKFAAVFALVLLVVRAAEAYGAGRGLYIVAMLAGLADVDAITLSMAGFARAGGAAGVAVTAMLLAALANTLVKLVLVLVLGAGPLRRHVSVAAAIVAALGFGAIALLR
jgi:uncharacterized membrane protein (DUF4010 family)